MKRSLLTVVLAAILVGCSATIEYHPFVGEEQILQGNGGACDLEEGIEIWVKGAPSKPFTVIGYVDGEYTDGIGEKSALKRLIVEKGHFRKSVAEKQSPQMRATLNYRGY